MTLYRAIPIGYIVFAAIGCAFAQDREPVKNLIEKLASTDFKTREAATKALLERPDAEGVLRAVMRSKDLEFSRRVAPIVEKLKWRRSPLRGIEKAAEEGQIHRAIDLIVDWRADMDRDSLWKSMQALASTLERRSNRTGKLAAIGAMPGVLNAPASEAFVRVKLFSRRTVVPRNRDGELFIVADEVDYEVEPKTKGRGDPWTDSLVVSSGRVRILELSLNGAAILAKGRVEIKGLFRNSVILSCSDVVLASGHLDNCLIIAKGAVDTSKGRLNRCTIIAGKKVSYDKVYTARSTMSENDPNPLGYIRWSDTPKAKTPAKKK